MIVGFDGSLCRRRAGDWLIEEETGCFVVMGSLARLAIVVEKGLSRGHQTQTATATVTANQRIKLCSCSQDCPPEVQDLAGQIEGTETDESIFGKRALCTLGVDQDTGLEDPDARLDQTHNFCGSSAPYSGPCSGQREREREDCVHKS